MSVIIRLQNLPWSANSLDIRQYFQGLSIPEGGVHIVGGELGDAFIAFSTDEDARQAMLIDGGKIKEVKIKLYLSSRTEMQKVIETARTQTLNLQSFMQMSAPPIIPQIPMQQQGPVLPMLNQMPTKVITPEIKPTAQQPSVLQPAYPQTVNVAIGEKKNTSVQSTEMEVNDLDSETASNKDKRDRRDRKNSRSVSRDRSRDRSKSRDRRDFRSRDRYRDRRRRDRSRSRDRRRRNRDRSRSKDRSSRKNSRERRKDYDKNSTTEGDKNKANKKSSAEENVSSQIPLAVVQKPGFTSSNWKTVNDKPNLLPKTQAPLAKPPIPPMLPQLQKPQGKNELNSNLSVDLDGRSQLIPDMFLGSNKLTAQMPENLMISRQTPLLPRPGIYPPPIMGLENKNDSAKHNLPQDWSRPPPDINRPPLIDNERMMTFNPYSNPALAMERRNVPPINNTFRNEDGLNRVSYLSQSNNEQFQSMFQNKPDIRMLNNFNTPMERSNYGAEGLPVERDIYRTGNLVDRQNPSSVDKVNYKPDSQVLERTGFRQEPLSDRGNYRNELNERTNQKQEPTNESGNYRQNPSMERGGYRPESIERNNQRPERPFLNNDRFSPMERPDRSSPYSQRQFNQRGKYNNSCIEVRNMSPSTTYSDLRRFFHGLFIPGDGIKIINDCQGNRIGIAYIRFAKPYCKEQALKKNGNYIKNTMVEVLHINDDLFDKAVDAPLPDGRNFSHDNRGRYNSTRDQEISTDDFIALAIREFPLYTKEKDIQNIFHAWKLADCFLLPKSGRRNASAYVKFFSMDDARKALAATSRYMIGNRKINVSICYEHEFQDARDIKNMEEDEDDRLVIDTKEEFSTKTNEVWSPPKDPRTESKAKPMKITEQKKETQPELNKTESQHLESQNVKEISQLEQKTSESTKVSELVQSKSQESELENSEPFTQDSNQFGVTQPNSSGRKERSINFMAMEQTQTNDRLPNSVAVDSSEKKNNVDAQGPIKQRPLLSTPLIKENPNILQFQGGNVAEFEKTIRNATDCIILRGLPYQANDRDIIKFFADEDIIPTQIHIMLDKAGNPAGDAFCEFGSSEEAEFALQKDNMLLGRNIISVLPVTREEMCEALGTGPSPDHQLTPGSFQTRPLHSSGRGGMRGRYRPNFHVPPYHYEQRLPPLMGYDHRRNVIPKQRFEEEFERGQSVDAFGKPGCVVALENVPFKADVDEILDFFRGFGVTRESVIRRYNELGNPTGDARVSLSSPQEAQRALKVLSHKQIRQRPIFIHLLS